MAQADDLATVETPPSRIGSLFRDGTDKPRSLCFAVANALEPGCAGPDTGYPETAGRMSTFTMSSELLCDLENTLQTAGSEANCDGIMTEWISANQEWADSLTAQSLHP